MLKVMKNKIVNKKELQDLLNSRNFLWSYNISNGNILSDEIIIEKSLLHLEFEELPMLFSLYNFNYIKKIWRENIVSQGEYYNIINWLLAVLFFNIQNPDKYLKRYGKPRKF